MNINIINIIQQAIIQPVVYRYETREHIAHNTASKSHKPYFIVNK